MAKIHRAFVLSYQANAHLYERFDVKRKIITALVKKDAMKLSSFTDSTIYFEMDVEEKGSLTDCKTILTNQFKLEKISFQYTLTAVWPYTTGTFMIDSKDGDMDLNSRFKIIVSEVREKENKPEKLE